MNRSMIFVENQNCGICEWKVQIHFEEEIKKKMVKYIFKKSSISVLDPDCGFGAWNRDLHFEGKNTWKKK